MYSFSTCWNSHRHSDGRAMLREIRELGFEYAELSHGIRLTLVPGILEAVDKGDIKISSLHNFCPLPMGVTQAAPNLYEFSAEDIRERDLAIKHTQKTFEFAARVKAKTIVLHLGSIEMKDYTGKLAGLLESDARSSKKFQILQEDALRAREDKKGKFYTRMKETLRKILPEAESRGLTLGCENRQALEELPLDEDFNDFFAEFQNPAVAYWHDTGHAQIKENLGVIEHARILQTLAPRLAGFHVHDVIFPDRDHMAPTEGMIDFAALKPFVTPRHIKVFELSPSLSLEAVRAGIKHIKSIWGD
ncbi:MAG TPA: TIM barrel protein [Verrucomicrobiae bacterium]|jgi:sugar phosphate isomerase/epimerase|nr:TIM barrel protein [Verrucomicrobiae bacterium]